jgi:hypothetical protein
MICHFILKRRASQCLILIFEVRTFGDLDTKKPWPHYVALARRVGEARSEQINGSLNSLEADVKVTVMRTFDGGR